MAEAEPIYLNLATEAEDPSVTELETVCMSCLEKGTTRLLLTLIPHFREVMVSSFSCPHCHNSNSSLLSTGQWQDKGVKYTLKVNTPNDLRRMIVKSDFASVKIPEVELEVPGRGDRGEITSVEGVINKVIEGLTMDQAGRRTDNPDLAEQLDAFIGKLKDLLTVTESFTLELNDPTGNSYIEQLGVNGISDKQVSFSEYERPPEVTETMKQVQDLNQPPEDKMLREKLAKVTEEDEEEGDAGETDANKGESKAKAKQEEAMKSKEEDDNEDVHAGVMQFNTLCDRCHRPANTNMKLTQIPHFKEVVIMATVCDHCGNRTSEVKSGGGIAPKGRLIVLTIDDSTLDMARDVLKSDTCSVEIPELELSVGAGVLGGRFTTLEGLLINIKEDIESNPFFTGDSVEAERKEKVKTLMQNIEKVINGELKVTIKLDDPAGNSYLQNLYAPDPDPGMEVTEYERTHEQNEDLGLNDMKTEGYEDEKS